MAVRINSGVIAVNSPLTNVGTPNNASVGFDYTAFLTGISTLNVTTANITTGTATAVDFVATSGAEFPLLTYSSFATANTTMATANTFYNGVSLALGSGTYLVTGQVTVASPANTSQRVTAKLVEGTATTYVAGESVSPALGAGTVGYVCLPLNTVLTLSTAGTAIIQVASTVANSVIQATPGDNGAGTPVSTNKATTISAVRIG